VGECRRKILVLSKHRLKPQKQKVPDDVVVDVALVQTGNDMLHAQLLLRVLEQRHKCPLAPVRELVLGDCHVEPVLPLNRFPLGANSTNAGCRKGQLDRFLNTDLVVFTTIGCIIRFQPILV